MPSDTNPELAEIREGQSRRLDRIEGKLDLPKGYYMSLRGDGSDWEFAIKLVVLIEAALGHVIAAKLQNDAMRDHCDRLNLVGRTGKIDLAGTLDILRPAEAKAMATLAEIRNRFAHKVANITLDLPTFAANLPKGEMAGMLKRLLMIPAEVEEGLRFMYEGEGTERLFRFSMWMSGLLILEALSAQDEHAEVEAERRRLWESGIKHTWTLADLWREGQAAPTGDKS